MKEAPRDIKLTQEKEQRKLGCWTVGKISFPVALIVLKWTQHLSSFLSLS